MVYGLMIHSVDSCQTLYFSIFYTPEGNDSQKKTRQQTIMRRILEEHLFQMHSADPEKVKSIKAIGADDDWLFRFSSDSKSSAEKLDYTEGILRFRASPLFEYPKLVAWKQVDKVAYTLVCEPLDNPLLATNFLTLFIHELQEHFRKGSNFRQAGNASGLTEEFTSRPDEILVILNFLLPGGQLLFCNFSLYTHFKTQIAGMLNQK